MSKFHLACRNLLSTRPPDEIEWPKHLQGLISRKRLGRRRKAPYTRLPKLPRGRLHLELLRPAYRAFQSRRSLVHSPAAGVLIVNAASAAQRVNSLLFITNFLLHIEYMDCRENLDGGDRF